MSFVTNYTCVLPDAFSRDDKADIEELANHFLSDCPQALPVLLAGGSLLITCHKTSFRLSLSEEASKPILSMVSKDRANCALCLSIIPVWTP